MSEETMPATLRIGLATVRNVPSTEERLQTAERILAEAATREVAIVCFPETYIPGLRGQDFEAPPPDQARQQQALERVCAMAGRLGVAVILPMEWETAAGLHNMAWVIGRDGGITGQQTKNQLPLEEAPYYVPDGGRRLFQIDGVPFGITICHEGWRYPEAVRWPAVRGALVVFHPQLTGSDRAGPVLSRWGDPDAPYYEKAMIARAAENNIYFASVNYAFRYQESATTVIGPEPEYVAHHPYGEEGLLVCDLDLTRATRLCATRFNPAFFPADEAALAR